MAVAFIIMQIGNPELDQICLDAIVPAIKRCGLEARRVDKHNRGELLKSEIVRFIRDSEIVVADLTNERRTATWKWASRWARSPNGLVSWGAGHSPNLAIRG